MDFSSAIRFITGLPGQAFQWGKDFIQGLINGISSMIQSVINTVSGLADRIRSFPAFLGSRMRGLWRTMKPGCRTL